MNKPELLAPAGNLEKLKTAINFGADAVYLGGSKLNLRASADNFTIEELKEGLEYAHSRGRKVHVTLNVIPHNEDLIGIEDYITELYETKDMAQAAVNKINAEEEGEARRKVNGEEE